MNKMYIVNMEVSSCRQCQWAENTYFSEMCLQNLWIRKHLLEVWRRSASAVNFFEKSYLAEIHQLPIRNEQMAI